MIQPRTLLFQTGRKEKRIHLPRCFVNENSFRLSFMQFNVCTWAGVFCCTAPLLLALTAVFIYGKKHLPGVWTCTRDGLVGWGLMGIGLFRENASNWTESRSKDLNFSSRRSYLGPSARATASTHIGRRQQKQECPFFLGSFPCRLNGEMQKEEN